ncbi:hypothetical protein L596_018743 [Steinernema carpocapsae]|uniref:Uncharacterized protein n=1 Tax=Steinernema carpocapsae TaxID=34508 RepID=A0A4U5N6N4_STECR|nr:hypothetical protein L596_018743 [Steinernema carpocapsae]
MSCRAMLTNWLELVGCHVVQEGDSYYETRQFPASSSSSSLASWIFKSLLCQHSSRSEHRSTYQVPDYSFSFKADIFWNAPDSRRELSVLFAKLRNDITAVFVPSETDSPLAKFCSNAEFLATLLDEIWRRQKVPDEWTDLKRCILMHNFGYNLLERVIIRRLALYGLYLGINANDNIKRRIPITPMYAIRMRMTTNPGGCHMAMIARLSDLGVPFGFVTIIRSFFKTIAPEKDPPQLSAFLFDWAAELLMAKSGITSSSRWQIGFRDYVLIYDNVCELRLAVENMRLHSPDYGVRINPAHTLVIRKRGAPEAGIEDLREADGFENLSEFVFLCSDLLDMPRLLGCHDFWAAEQSFDKFGPCAFNTDVYVTAGWFENLVARNRPFAHEDCKTELRILISSVKLCEEEQNKDSPTTQK